MVRCRRDTHAVASPLNARGRLPVRAALLALLAGTAGGCSLSVPLAGVPTDDAPTGAVDRAVALLPPSLDGEDLRRARAAMAVTLDPQGNGARVAWQNPQSGARGAFSALGGPYPDHDRVCRAFTGEATPAGGAPRKLSGAACRQGDGSWLVVRGEG